MKLGTHDKSKVWGCLTKFANIYAVAMETVVTKVTRHQDVYSRTHIICVDMIRYLQKEYMVSS